MYIYNGESLFDTKKRDHVPQNFKDRVGRLLKWVCAPPDYFAYAIHNLIESVLTMIKSKVTKKDWIEAFYAIEAVTYFFEVESDWASEWSFELQIWLSPAWWLL
jgi:hypothetical protein